MNRLFSPWRSQYIASFVRKQNDDACLFCAAAASKNDARNLIVHRGKHCFVMMNLYPYNSGHMMVVPYRHTADISALTAKENAEILATTARMVEALKKVSAPHGFNVGINLGRAGGAGIDQHVHVHVVPRWNGDTNFMATVADTKLVSEGIKSTYRKLRAAARRRSR